MESTGKERLFFLPGALAGTWTFLDISALAAREEPAKRGLTFETTADSFIPAGLAVARTLSFKLSNFNSSFYITVINVNVFHFVCQQQQQHRSNETKSFDIKLFPILRFRDYSWGFIVDGRIIVAFALLDSKRNSL